MATFFLFSQLNGSQSVTLNNLLRVLANHKTTCSRHADDSVVFVVSD